MRLFQTLPQCNIKFHSFCSKKCFVEAWLEYAKNATGEIWSARFMLYPFLFLKGCFSRWDWKFRKVRLIHVPFLLQLSINKYKCPIDAYFFTPPHPIFPRIFDTLYYAGQFKASALSKLSPVHSQNSAHCLLLAPRRHDPILALARSVLLCPPCSVPNLSLGFFHSFALGASNWKRSQGSGQVPFLG